jgi:hypothetical protein
VVAAGADAIVASTRRPPIRMGVCGAWWELASSRKREEGPARGASRTDSRTSGKLNGTLPKPARGGVAGSRARPRDRGPSVAREGPTGLRVSRAAAPQPFRAKSLAGASPAFGRGRPAPTSGRPGRPNRLGLGDHPRIGSLIGLQRRRALGSVHMLSVSGSTPARSISRSGSRTLSRR